MSDFLWEILDNALYVGHWLAVIGVIVAAVACPALLWQIRDEIRRRPSHECHCRRDVPEAPKHDRPRLWREPTE